jgi:hypothetical protein
MMGVQVRKTNKALLVGGHVPIGRSIFVKQQV